MNKYELTVCLDAKSTPAKVKALVSQIEKIVAVFKGKVVEAKDWGVRDVFLKDGSLYFYYFLLELESGMLKGLSQKIKMEEGIKRQLLVKI